MLRLQTLGSPISKLQEGSLTEQDWMDLSKCFVRTSFDSNDVRWDQAHRVFYDNTYPFEYKMSRLQKL